jgi:type III secretion protein L
MADIQFLKKGRFEIQPGQTIIKARSYLDYVEAGRILERAHQEAEQILEDARKAREEEKQRGYQDGITEGKANMSRQMIDTISKTINYFSTVEEKVVEIVITAVRKILGTIGDETVAHQIVKNALGMVRNQKQITLRVCPSELEMIKNRINEIMAMYPGISFVDIVPDARLKKGGCILESDMGVVDASVDSQIENIRQSLLKSFQRSGQR